MKTKIKRHSRSVLSVVLAVCMLLSCMTAGMIMTDAAKVDSETVGGNDSNITDYFFKGSFDSWTKHYVNSSGEASININTAGTYEFVVITGSGTQKCDNHTFTRSATSYNTTRKTPNFKITADVAGTYTFKTSTVDSGGSLRVNLTFPPSGGGSTSTDWRLVDGGCNWTYASSNKKFTLNSSTGLYEYSQYFTGNNYFRISDGTSQYQGQSTGNYTIGTNTWTSLVQTNDDAFAFTPSPAGTYIVQVDATNKKIRIQSAQKYNITCNTASSGSISASPTSASAGENVIITVTPNSGYALKSLVLNYDDADHDVTSRVSGNSYTFEMPAFNVTATPTFTNSKTIYFNNYEAKWSKVYVYTKNANGEEGNGAAPGTEMTQVGTSSIYSAEIPADTNTNYIVFSGSGGATNQGATIKCGSNNNFGNALPTTENEYKATKADGTTGEWTTHSDRNNVYTVTPGTSITGNNSLYYNGIAATMYDYYTDGEYNDGSAKWITGIKDYEANKTLAEYSIDNGTQFNWNPYRTLNEALSDYAAEKSIPYPLYFGNLNLAKAGEVGQSYLEYYRDNTTPYTNWSYKINNSMKLNPSTASITELAADTESNSTIAHSNSNGNGTAMAMFDEDWLSQENSTGNPLATILHSSAFPVRKIDAKVIYLDISSASDTWGSAGTIAANFHNGNTTSGNKRVIMNNLGNGLYSVSVPSGYTQVEWQRLNPANLNGNAWNYKNAGAFGTNNKYKFTSVGSEWNNVTGSWSNDTTLASSYTYYEYDSTDGTDNAYIQNVKKSDHTATIEYSTTDKAYSANAGSGSTAGFYPFDNMKASDNSHTSDIDNVHLGNNRPHDLGFGVKLEIPFSLNENGTVDGTADGIAQTFNFSGDDDLWVYIDGHLVLDLGGAHQKAEGSINFKTKTATSTTKTVDAATAAASTNNSQTLTASNTYSGTLGTWFDSKSEALHTMTIYYMERGMFESNLKFDFSFHAIQNLYTTEKKIRTGNINSGFYVKDATTTDPVTGMTKFEASYQYEHFNVDHKVSSNNTTYANPANKFNYARVEITPTPNGDTKVTHTEEHAANAALVYNLTNDDRAQFNGKFTSGDYFQLTETPVEGNKYSYTPTLTVYDDTDKSGKTKYNVTPLGNNSFKFRFDEPNNGLKTVNVRGQLENVMKQHDLTITKSIGDKTDDTTEFEFQIKFKFAYHKSNDTVNNTYEGYPLYLSSDKDATKTQTYSKSQSHGYFKLKAGETITIPKIPEGAEFEIIETLDNITNYTYGGMSAVGATATPVDGENAVTMTMGEDNINVTAMNNDNTVKGTIRVKYAPSYYDFEQGTNISQDTYTNTNGSYTNPAVVTKCETSFTDSAASSTVISEQTMVETDRRNASESFEVSVDKVNDGGKLFIGWYDENGNRYHDDDATQHEFTASAPKDQDRIFEARFITAPTYRLDFKVPTRLWGERIYKVFGKVDNSMISQGYIGYDSSRETTASVEKRYYLTGDFVEAKKPSETIFLKDITWPDIDDGKTDTEYKKSKWVTCNDVTSKNVETVTLSGNVTYDLYRAVAAQVDDRKVTIDFFNDCSKPNTLNFRWEGNYGDVVLDHSTIAQNIPNNKTFYRWKIETLNSLGSTALTPNEVLVTYDYSKNFNYVAYDNYKVTVELLNKEPGGTEYSPYASKNDDNPYHDYAPKNTTSVINLGQTRSHWNDTTDGLVYVPDHDKGESVNNTNANYNYDRMFIDLALSYSDGKETKLNTVDNLNVGFIIQYWDGENWINWKTEEFSSKLLGDKNRIEYYYGFQNAAGNRVEKKFRVQPIIDGVPSGTPLEFDFSASQFSAQTNY